MIKFYQNNSNIISGITLNSKDKHENFSMALHTCENPEHILENRQELAAYLQTPLQQFVCANQTHSAHFHKVSSEDIGRGSTDANNAIPNTDALYTFEKNVVLCSFTADCVPVLFYHEEDGMIGAIHSGWQGTVKEISRHLLQHLKIQENCDLSKLHVQIGPALSQEKFEVDEDVYLKFKSLGYADDYIYYNEKTQKYHINNQLTVKKQFELAGVPTNQIQIDPTCTHQSDTGFSYRRDKTTGRHVSFISQK